MAKNNAAKDSDQDVAVPRGGKDRTNGDFGHEIWGIVLMAVGLLVGVSLVSWFVNKPDNILGRYLGSDLSAGLIWLLGPITVFIVPAAVLYLGWIRLRGKIFPVRSFILWCAFIVEVCTLLAIHNLPRFCDALFVFGDNAVGNTVTYGLHFIFGTHRFGPYFIFLLALFITVLIGLRIPVAAVGTMLRPLCMAIRVWFVGLMANLFKPRAPQIDPEPAPQAPAAVTNEDIKSGRKIRVPKGDETPGVTPAAVITATPRSPVAETEDEKTKRLLDQQLAAFRAKRNEPINILTPDNTEIEEVGTEDEEAEKEGELRALREAAMETPDQKKGGRKGKGKEDQSQPQDGPQEPVATDEEPQRDGDGDGPVLSAEIGGFTPAQPAKTVIPYQLPPPDKLSEPPMDAGTVDRDAIELYSHTLEKTLLNFGVEGKVVNVSPGPVINRYEIELAPGIKVSRVLSLQDDISMAVGGQKIRIQAPIPGKAAIGIEIPNTERQVVHFKHILMSDAFRKGKAKLPVVVGKTISGMPFVTDIAKMPHLLIAGQTGSGKSVCINSLICSLLMTKTPEELRVIMIDPKKVELASYEQIPHLLSPVVTESKEAVKALQWAVIEMERRYRVLAKAGARNLEAFNTRITEKKVKEGVLTDEENRLLPFIVIVVDELADLMMTASRDVEGLIQRIAQLARAVGIHLVVATQRPSVDIITGPIKANLTSRIAFRTIQSTDSRTILGHVGAEKLLGNGDMLFLRSGAPDIERYHGAFISDEDVESIVAFIRSQYVEIEKIESFEKATSEGGSSGSFVASEPDDRDELFPEAARTIVSIGQGSTSLLQRRMKVGYARAGRLMDELEKAGIVGPQEGAKVREVRILPEDLDEIFKQMGY